jgi:hypothetical protein
LFLTLLPYHSWSKVDPIFFHSGVCIPFRNWDFCVARTLIYKPRSCKMTMTVCRGELLEENSGQSKQRVHSTSRHSLLPFSSHRVLFSSILLNNKIP